jgi:hypothetical protein
MSFAVDAYWSSFIALQKLLIFTFQAPLPFQLRVCSGEMEPGGMGEEAQMTSKRLTLILRFLQDAHPVRVFLFGFLAPLCASVFGMGALCDQLER